MNAKPLQNRVVVHPLEAESESSGGIIIPDTATEKPSQGTVLAAGPGKRTSTGSVIAMTVKTGDRVLYSKGAGNTIKLNGQEVVVLTEDEIFAVIEEN